MKKHYRILLVPVLFVVSSLGAADQRAHKKEYKHDVTQNLQMLVDQMDDDSRDEVFKKVIPLVRKGADPDQCQCSRNSICPFPLLQYGVEFDNQEVVQCLLDNRANPDIRNPAMGGITPLFCIKSLAMAQLLLKYGADLHARIPVEVHGSPLLNGDDTALHYVARFNRSAHVLAVLCREGLDPNTPDRLGNTAFHNLFLCIENTQNTLKSAGVLSWYAADIDRENKKGQKPLDIQEESDPSFVFRVREVTRRLLRERDNKCRELAVLLATHLRAVNDVATIVSQYAGTPALSPADIDSWDVSMQRVGDGVMTP